MTVFVTGGTGFVGRAVVEKLLAQGHAVRLLVHKNTDDEQPNVVQIPGDVSRKETFADAIRGCSVVIHLVGIIREFPDRGITFRKLHVEATRNVLEAARATGVTRFIHMSALGTRPNASSEYHRTKFEAEELVRNSGCAWTIFRPSLIFGKDDAFVNMFADYIRRFHVVPVIGDGKYRLQPIAVEDVARCFVDALGMKEAEGKTFEICGEDRLTYLQVLEEIGSALNSKFVTLKSPTGLMKAIVPVLQKFPAFPLTTDQMTMLLEENICDGRWQEAFRFKPTPFREGIRQYLKGNP